MLTSEWYRPHGPVHLSPEVLARNVFHGAMCELRLTPKPGLVDRRDCGSHPDLTYGTVSRSASMLPGYFQEILEAHRRDRGMAAYVAAGRRAEERMLAAVGSNAHRGFIFLGGVLLLAACQGTEEIGELRLEIAQLAEEFYSDASLRRAEPESHGGRVRREYAMGGIRAEALAGLPSIFEVGLPALAESLDRHGDFVLASYSVISRLMQCVEDTTAVHRCGPEGLTRLHRDGAVLERACEEGGDVLPLLERWNEEYRAIGLTMGGVADCLGLTFALYLTLAHAREPEIAGLDSLLLRDAFSRASLLPPPAPRGREIAWTSEITSNP